MTPGTLLVLAILAVFIGIGIRSMVREHKRGGHPTCPGCNGNACGSCSNSENFKAMARRMEELTKDV